MALYRRGSSRVWWIDITDPTGKRHRLSTKTENKQLAVAFEAKFERDLFERIRLGKTNTERTLKDAVDRLLAEKEGKDVTESYRQQLGWWMEQIGQTRKLSEITKDVILDTIAVKAKEASKATCNRYLAALRACLNLACKKLGWIESVPPFFMYEEPKGRTRWLRPDEISRLVNALPEHLQAPAIVALSTGLRRTVVTCLRWEQVDLSRKVITVLGDEMKNGENHAVPLPDVAVDVIRGQIGKHHERVFTYMGRPFDRCSTRTWRDALAAAGIEDFRWHDLRHTWATMLTQSGVPDSVLMTLGCWKSAKMVRRYAHHNVESVRAHTQAIDQILPAATTQLRHTPHLAGVQGVAMTGT